MSTIMDFSGEFEARKKALQLMRRRTVGELKRLEQRVSATAHRRDEEMEAALQKAQAEMNALVAAASEADNQEAWAANQLGVAMEKALQESEEILHQLEATQAARAEELHTLEVGISHASLDLEDQLMQVKRDLRNEYEQTIASMQRQTKDRTLRLEELSKQVRNEYRALIR